MTKPSSVDQLLDGFSPNTPAPRILPLEEGASRPLLSVMIPTYNCAAYLRQTLESILDQDPGEELMEIVVVDDCSTKDDPEQVVKDHGRGRVVFSRNESNTGYCTKNFNVCVRKSRGQWVHILHGDDYVFPGFYPKILEMTKQHPDASFLATRSVFIDETNCWLRLGPVVEPLDSHFRDTFAFRFNSPVQCAGVVVKRSFYEEAGGFREDLVHTADMEMWQRAISQAGGVIASDVLSAYRVFEQNDTGQLMRSGNNIVDRLRLGEIFASRIPELDRHAVRAHLIKMARHQHAGFVAKRDEEAAAANLEIAYTLGYRPPAFHRKVLGRLKRIIGSKG